MLVCCNYWYNIVKQSQPSHYWLVWLVTQVRKHCTVSGGRNWNIEHCMMQQRLIVLDNLWCPLLSGGQGLDTIVQERRWLSRILCHNHRNIAHGWSWFTASAQDTVNTCLDQLTLTHCYQRWSWWVSLELALIIVSGVMVTRCNTLITGHRTHDDNTQSILIRIIVFNSTNMTVAILISYCFPLTLCVMWGKLRNISSSSIVFHVLHAP